MAQAISVLRMLRGHHPMRPAMRQRVLLNDPIPRYELSAGTELTYELSELSKWSRSVTRCSFDR